MSAFAERLDAAVRQQAVVALEKADATLFEALEVLFRAKYTGAVTLHLHEGRPRIVQIPNPVSVQVI